MNNKTILLVNIKDWRVISTYTDVEKAKETLEMANLWSVEEDRYMLFYQRKS